MKRFLGPVSLVVTAAVAVAACGSRDLYMSGHGGGAPAETVPETENASESDATSRPTAVESHPAAPGLQDGGEHDGQGPHGHHGHADGSGTGPMQGHQHTFENAEEYAARWEGPERDAWQQPEGLVAALGIEPGMIIADLGTGTGYLLPWLSEAAGSEGVVLAIDLQPTMLEWVNGRIQELGWTNVRTHQGEYNSPALDADSLDRAVMLNVWHHIEHRDVYAAALLQSMKPGGRAFIVETSMDAPDGPPMHFRLPPEAVIEVLQAAGFEASLTDWQNERQYMVQAIRPE